MKIRLQFYMSILTIFVLTVVPIMAQAASSSPFVGHWQAIDIDGSDIRLTIAGPPNGPFQITWTESYISFCGGEAGIVRGTGLLNESDSYLLEASLHLECFTTDDSLDFEIIWIYDPGTDTISSDNLTWHRPGQRNGKCLPPPTGLTGWWPGDGDTNDIVSGRDGVFYGDATTGSGLVDLAFGLDGEGDFIEIPDSPGLNFGPGNFTVDLWVNFNDTSGEQVLVEKWIQGEGYVDGWTFTKLENQALRLALDSGDGTEASLDTAELALLPGIWYHFAATRQGSVVTLFMNGQVVAQNSEMDVPNLNSPSSLKFGHRGNPEDTPGSIDERGFYLNGRIDEVELFVGSALSDEQVMALYTAGSDGKCKEDVQPPPTLDLRVNYGHDWVESFYEAGHMVWITVTESDGMTVKATAEVLTEPKDFWEGEAGFQTNPEDWDPEPPDIQPDDWVYAWVDNGASAQVQIGDISGTIDLMGDSIQGTIDAPWFSSEVVVECHPWGSPEPVDMKAGSVVPDGSDPYSCSWAGEWDIQPGQDVGVGYFGSDGHWVANAFFVPMPVFAAYMPSTIEGYNWPLGDTITLNINNGEYTATALSEQRPDFPEGETRVLFELWRDEFSMQAGDHILMTDESNTVTKELWVASLQVTDINLNADTVSGIYEPSYSFWMQVDGQEPLEIQFNEDTWVATFAELIPGTWGFVAQDDEDADGTVWDFYVPNPPRILVQITDDWFEAQNFTPNAELTFWIYDAPDGDLLLGPEYRLLDDNGTVGVGMWEFETPLDLKPGNYLVVSDGSITKELVLEALTFDVFDASQGVLQGTAPPSGGRLVWVGIGWEQDGWSMEVMTDPDGNWTANYGGPIPGDYQWVAAQVFDPDGDASEVRPPN
jgi:hypothetical protein